MIITNHEKKVLQKLIGEKSRRKKNNKNLMKKIDNNIIIL